VERNIYRPALPEIEHFPARTRFPAGFYFLLVYLQLSSKEVASVLLNVKKCCLAFDSVGPKQEDSSMEAWRNRPDGSGVNN
jgi:hypothetical protein